MAVPGITVGAWLARSAEMLARGGRDVQLYIVDFNINEDPWRDFSEAQHFQLIARLNRQQRRTQALLAWLGALAMVVALRVALLDETFLPSTPVEEIERCIARG